MATLKEPEQLNLVKLNVAVHNVITLVLPALVKEKIDALLAILNLKDRQAEDVLVHPENTGVN